ncbi:MAG: Clp protease N-terminal domain-containing protein [Burkholderiales bacterium]
MFTAIKRRFQDARTIKVLLTAAEKHANKAGHKQPAAEHLVLAALDLPDGTARRTFERLQRDPMLFQSAIEQQYQDALRQVGVELSTATNLDELATPIPPTNGLFRAQPSAQALMQELANEVMRNSHAADSTMPLVGAHVLLSDTAAQFGVVARALQTMGIDRTSLAKAASQELQSWR